MFHRPFHLSFHHSRCDTALSLFASKWRYVSCYALTACAMWSWGSWLGGSLVSAWCFCCFTHLLVWPGDVFGFFRLFLLPYHVETIQCYHLLHELAHELAPVTPWFCGFVLCWCFFVCFVLVGLLLVSVCFLVWFLVVTSLLFFRPTPSWLPPGRYTRSIAAKRWIVIIMQGCLLVDSHKSTGSGPVRSPASCPSKKPKKHNQKQKKPSKPKTHNHNQTKTNKKTQRSGIATSNGNNMHDDILCVIMRMATEQEAKQRKHRTTQRGQVRGW